MENLTRDDLQKMFDEKLGDHTKSMLAVLKEEMAKGERKSRLIDTVTVNPGNGSISIDNREKRGLRAAKFIRVAAAAKKFGKSVLDVAKSWKADEIVDSIETKTNQAQVAEDGGLLVPEPVIEEIADLLRAAMVVDASGASSVPMSNGNLSMNYQETSAQGQYVGEIAVIPVSSAKLGRMKLSAKKLAALVPVSNDFLRYGMDSSEEFIRNDLVRSLSVRKDLALIRDDGSSDTPKGMRWLAPAANVVDRSLDGGFVTLETITNDLSDAAMRLEQANIPMIRPGFLMSPRTKWFLLRQRDGLGNQVFREEMSRGTLFGFPFKVTTNIPNNLGVGGDESEIYLVDFASIIIGEAMNMEIAISDQASFVQGTQQNGFQQDETLVRALMAHDVNARYRGNEITVIKSVDWF